MNNTIESNYELGRLIREQEADDTDRIKPERINKGQIKNFTSISGITSKEPTPEQIAIAKIDGICPICDKNIDVFQGALCECGFSMPGQTD